jgi:hypothetical protein
MQWLNNISKHESLIVAFNDITVVLNGCETWSLALREGYTDRGCLRTGCCGEYLDPKGIMLQGAGKYCTVRSFIIYTL